jgi:hypothetical protein
MDYFAKKTQKQIVVEKIERDGYVDNFWAISNRMLRLGAIIADLKKDGYKFATGWGKDSQRKNYHYYSLAHCEMTLFGYQKKKVPA